MHGWPAGANLARERGQTSGEPRIYVHIYIYIYIYIERERDRYTYVCMYVCMCIYIYIYIYMYVYIYIYIYIRTRCSPSSESREFGWGFDPSVLLLQRARVDAPPCKGKPEFRPRISTPGFLLHEGLLVRETIL